uniref:Uncharacterized protein n=1 Tax=Arundo donax TaxID=35708 RepID=A0A0A9C735_ARUDO
MCRPGRHTRPMVVLGGGVVAAWSDRASEEDAA